MLESNSNNKFQNHNYNSRVNIKVDNLQFLLEYNKNNEFQNHKFNSRVNIKVDM